MHTFRFTLVLGLCGFNCIANVALAQGELRNLRISDRVQRHLDDADDCRVNNDFDCARASLSEVSRRELTDFEQYQYSIQLGYVEFLDGNFPGAIEAYKSAAVHSRQPAQTEYHLRSVAQLHASLGQFQDAYDTLESLLAEDGASRYSRRYELRSVAQRQANLGQYQNAYDTLEELLVRNGANPLSGRHLTDDGLWQGFDIYATGDRILFPLGARPPSFPREAAARGLSQGFVLLEFTVTRTGSTRDIQVIESSDPVFERSAIEGAEGYRYKPRLVDGKPVETLVQRRIEFRSEGVD